MNDNDIFSCFSKTKFLEQLNSCQGLLKANLHIPHRAPAVPCRANSHMSCCAPAVLRQCHVRRESPRVAGKIRKASRETPRGSRKKTKPRQTSAVNRRPMLIHTNHAVPLPCCAVALRSHLQSGMVGARQEHGMVCVNQTRSHCVIQMGKTKNKSLETRHSGGTPWCV